MIEQQHQQQQPKRQVRVSDELLMTCTDVQQQHQQQRKIMVHRSRRVSSRITTNVSTSTFCMIRNNHNLFFISILLLYTNLLLLQLTAATSLSWNNNNHYSTSSIDNINSNNNKNHLTTQQSGLVNKVPIVDAKQQEQLNQYEQRNQQQEQNQIPNKQRILQQEQGDTDYVLLDGTVVTRTNVLQYAQLAYDIRDIRFVIKSHTTYDKTSGSTVRNIFTNGANAEIRTTKNNTTTTLLSFQLLIDDLARNVVGSTTTSSSSVNATTNKLLDEILPSTIATPVYLFQLYGFSKHSVSSSNSTSGPNLISYAKIGYEIIDKYITQSGSGTVSASTYWQLVPDAILLHAVWMYSTHVLWDGLNVCRIKAHADNPSIIHNKRYGMDEFIALWIGFDQQIGSAATGYSLYAWTQRISILFGTATPTTEAPVNTQLKLLYQEGAAVLALENSCLPEKSNTRSSSSTSTSSSSTATRSSSLTGSSNAYKSYSVVTTSEKQLYYVIVRIMKQMMIPLFQYVIYYLYEENTIALKLYSKALVPQLSRCRVSLYENLYKHMLGTDSYVDYTLKHDMYNNLIDIATKCFNIRPYELGTYYKVTTDNDGTTSDTNTTDANTTDTNIMDEEIDEQDDIGAIGSPPILAGYAATTSVGDLSKIDLDLHQIRTLLLLNQQQNEYARYIYEVGYNVPTYRKTDTDPYELISIQQIATGQVLSYGKANVNQYYTAYLNYYNNRDYMNEQIIKGFDISVHNLLPPPQGTVTMTGSSNDATLTATAYQRSEFIRFVVIGQILFLHIMTVLEDTTVACYASLENVNDGELNNITLYDITNPLDEVAAFLIGSMEGSAMGGSYDPRDEQLLYGLAEIRSFQFQRKNNLDLAIANADLIHELYAAKAQLNALSCPDVSRTIDHIKRLIHVGIFQTIIFIAVQLETSADKLSTVDRNTYLIRGQAITGGILPMIYEYNAPLASTLKEYMVNNGAKAVNAQKVADILSEYAYQSLGLSCQYLGTYSSVRPCLHSKESGTDTTSNSIMIMPSSSRSGIVTILSTSIVLILQILR